jgi:hypothetical protein
VTVSGAGAEVFYGWWGNRYVTRMVVMIHVTRIAITNRDHTQCSR